jgi:hypothetical protein
MFKKSALILSLLFWIQKNLDSLLSTVACSKKSR